MIKRKNVDTTLLLRLRALGAVVATMSMALASGCSSTQTNLPLIGNCDAHCSLPIASVGISPVQSSEAGSGVCPVDTTDSLCLQCLSADCCRTLNACESTAECQNLVNCEGACTNTACTAGCEQAFPNGAIALDALNTCETAECPVCSQLGVGDSCDDSGSTCNAGLSCTGLWCTEPCSLMSDCVGLGAAGGNVLGQPNACIPGVSGSDTCVPGCTTDSDCQSFPATYCLSTTSVAGSSVMVCTSPPDAGPG
ncbi:MAG: hypothetical protein ABSF69_06160 [Polyangiaceae bacterium]|jgi:hypothetical protein